MALFPDVVEYAPKIGIDVSKEPHLLYLAREALNTKLPDYWKPWLAIWISFKL